jgi:hypothetical protein
MEKKDILDFKFLEFYIDKKYNMKVETYFNVSKIAVSTWRKNNNIPDKRIMSFQNKEGSLFVSDLLNNIYIT